MQNEKSVINAEANMIFMAPNQVQRTRRESLDGMKTSIYL